MHIPLLTFSWGLAPCQMLHQKIIVRYANKRALQLRIECFTPYKRCKNVRLVHSRGHFLLQSRTSRSLFGVYRSQRRQKVSVNATQRPKTFVSAHLIILKRMKDTWSQSPLRSIQNEPSLWVSVGESGRNIDSCRLLLRGPRSHFVNC